MDTPEDAPHLGYLGQTFGGRFRAARSIPSRLPGLTFRAQDLELRRMCTLFVLPISESAPEGTAHEVIDAARTGDAARHAHIAATLAFGLTDGGNAMYYAIDVTRPLAFRSLLLRQDAALIGRRFPRWLASLAQCLHTIHKRKAIYGTLRTASLFFDTQGTPQLAPVGLMNSISELSALDPRFRSQEIGSATEAPELADDGRAPTPKSDQYSVASIGALAASRLYDAKFDASSALASRRHIRRATPKWLWKTELGKVLDRATALRPGQRYRTCEQFAAAIDRVQDVPIEAPRFLSRSLVASGAGVGAVVAAAVFFALREGPSERTEPETLETHQEPLLRIYPESMTKAEADRLLVDSVRSSDPAGVRWAADRGASIEGKTISSVPLLHFAARHGTSSLINALIDVGAPINETADASLLFREVRFTEATPLHIASLSGRGERVKALIAKGADMAARCEFVDEGFLHAEAVLEGREGRSGWWVRGAHPLHLAAMADDSSALHALFEARPNMSPDIRCADDDTPLHCAAAYDRAGNAGALLERDASPHIKHVAGLTPMTEAIAAGATSVLDVMRRHHPDVLTHADDDSDGMLPIHYAVYLGKLDVVRYLVRVGVSVEQQDARMHTPLVYALWHERTDVADWLITSGADLRVRVHDGWSLFDEVVNYKSLGGLKWLLKQDVEDLIDSAASDGLRPVERAVALKQSRFVSLLLASGASPEGRPGVQTPPLHWAAANGDVETLKVLLKHHPDVNEIGAEDKSTALHFAVNRGMLSAVTILLRAGASVSVKNKHGTTPMDMATSIGRLDILSKLRESEK